MTPQRTLVIGCGALARELRDLVELNRLDHVDVECLPAALHNRPSEIPEAVRERIHRARAAGGHDRILVGYADCGTGGRLDAVCDAEGVERIPGAHCYEFYAGSAAFAELFDAEPGSFYLTDYLVRHFDRIVISGLGLDRHPQLRDDYFGNYRRLVHLAQTDDPELERLARAAADRLGLTYHPHPSGYGELASFLDRANRPVPVAPPTRLDPGGPR